MHVCPTCGEKGKYLSESIGECPRCARGRKVPAEGNISFHVRSRNSYGLPFPVPSSKDGLTCKLCGSHCRTGEGEKGFCGIREHRDGKIAHLAGNDLNGIYEWYFDPLPTNCVADRVCPGGTGAGYPEYAYRKGPEIGYKNLAVFMGSCSFNCLFCQNSSYKALAQNLRPKHPRGHISSLLREDTACICFFGGDPSSQMPFVIAASEEAMEHRKRPILRVCLETNGCMNLTMLGRMMKLIIRSGGCIKFDIKAHSDNLFHKLTGQKRTPSVEAFETAASCIKRRPNPPLVVASTLLVPGYVDHREIGKISKWIASLDENIPYSLLAFYPRHMMRDLPRTSRADAVDALNAARDEGLKRVHIGNEHLLW